MMDFLNSLPPRNFFTTLGMILSIAVMVLLLLMEYKITWRMVIATAMAGAVTITSGVGGQFARKLTYGGWLDPSGFIGNFAEYEGTHYIGAALYIMWLAPLLWRLIMRKDKGVFARNGLNRHMSILSVYAIIQAFIGRIGCLSAGCCYGRAHYGLFSVPCVGRDYPTYPAVYTELFLSLVTLVLIVILYTKKRNTAPVFCIGYGLSIFISEFLYDRAGTLTIFNMSAIQLCAIALILTGAIYAAVRRVQNGHITDFNKNKK